SFLSDAFPGAPIYTSAYLPDRTFEEFKARDVRVLPGAGWARTETAAKRLLPLWIHGFRQLDLGAYDVVLSSPTFAAKHVPPARARWGARDVRRAGRPAVIGGAVCRVPGAAVLQ